jgi:hypothetical protein
MVSRLLPQLKLRLKRDYLWQMTQLLAPSSMP